MARRGQRSPLRALALAALGSSAVTLVLLAGSASASDPIFRFSALPSTTQAGGHPDLEVSFAVSNRALQNNQSACDCEDPKDITVHLPTGFIGNPHATPQCTLAEFSANECPIDAQVGVVRIHPTGGVGLSCCFDSVVYNLVPPPQDPGLLGFKIILFGSPQFTVLSARTGGDYGLDAKVTSIFHAFPLEEFQEVLWGVPADPSHDPLRLNPEFNPNGPGQTAFIGELCDENGALSSNDPSTVQQFCGARQIPPSSSNSPLTPFLQNPTRCSSSLPASLEVLSYDGGTTQAEESWPQPSGCDQLSFNPSLYAQPTSTETDSPSGIDVNLSVPQQLSPTIPSPSELQGATVTLPPGFTINSSAADGKTACADEEANFGSEEAGSCPEYARIGSLEIDSSALPGPLPGSVYLGAPLPGDRYRIFLVADGFATHIKLIGTVTPDPATGQLVITFKDLPQSPLTAFDMHLFGSERGLLATPTQCGTYPVTSTFTPWNETIGTQTSTQFFTLTSGPAGAPCPGSQRPFNPAFSAGVTDSTAGAHSHFVLNLTRADGDQFLSALNVRTPPGFSATLAGIPYCSDAALAAAAEPSYSGLAEEESPSCPAASQVGTATAGAGAGNHPVYTPGKVYLAGPYKGAPLSLAVITPAVSGPYDLGNVVLRVALHVDPTDAQITAVSDPLPQILQGIPLRLREIAIELNRPGFVLNPTNCEPLSISAQVSGSEGAGASLQSPFQAAECAELGFAPRLSLALSGSTRRAGTPAFKAVLTMPSGGANIARAQVTLPPSEIIDNAHINNVCSQAQFNGPGCPANSVIGHAKAETPLLEKPLEGPVYLMTGFGHALPDVAADLNGQLHVLLHAKVDTGPSGGLRNTFEVIPDAPVSRFVLSLAGGDKGLLQNSEAICSKSHHALAVFSAQNEKTDVLHPVLQLPCGSTKPKRSRRHLRSAGRVR